MSNHWLDEVPNGWLREGFLQVALAALEEDAPPMPAVEKAREGPFDLLLTQERIPGAREVGTALGKARKGRPVKLTDCVLSVADAFIASLDQKSSGDWHLLLARALEQREADWRRGPRPSAEARLGTGPAGVNLASLWANQAIGLHLWRTTSPVAPAADPAWQDRCEQLLAAIKGRNEEGKGWFMRKLAEWHSPNDYRLFQDVIGTLEEAAGRIDPAAVPRPALTIEARVGEVPLPPTWPPLLLAQQLSVEVLRKLRDQVQAAKYVNMDATSAWGELLRLATEEVRRKLSGPTDATKKAQATTAKKAEASPTRKAEASPPVPQRTWIEWASEARMADKAWEAWGKWDARGDLTDGQTLVMWFNAFYRRYHELSGPPEKELYRQAVLGLLKEMRERKVELAWKLDNWDLSPDDLKFTKLNVQYNWFVPDEAIPYTSKPTVIADSFGDKGRPPQLRFGVGQNARKELLPWLYFRLPDEKGLAGKPWDVLKRWQGVAWMSLGTPDKQAELVEQAKAELSQALHTPEGEEWLDRLEKLARAEPDGPAARCRQVLLAQRWYHPLDATQEKALGAISLLFEQHPPLKGPLADGWKHLVRYVRRLSPEQRSKEQPAEQAAEAIEPLLNAVAALSAQKQLREPIAELLRRLGQALAGPPWGLALVPPGLELPATAPKSVELDQLIPTNTSERWGKPTAPAPDAPDWGAVCGIQAFGLMRGEEVVRPEKFAVAVGLSAAALEQVRALLDQGTKCAAQAGALNLKGHVEAVRQGLRESEGEFNDALLQFYRELHGEDGIQSALQPVALRFYDLLGTLGLERLRDAPLKWDDSERQRKYYERAHHRGEIKADGADVRPGWKGPEDEPWIKGLAKYN